MTFGEKLCKLRKSNALTQEELADKLYVTRTAVSKWETGNGYPAIDSLQQIAKLFGVTVDELLSDEDSENKKLLDEKNAKKCYIIAIAFLVFTTGCSLIGYFLLSPYLYILSVAGMVGYVAFGLLSTPKYKRVEKKKLIVPFILSRVLLLCVILTVLIGAFSVGN